MADEEKAYISRAMRFPLSVPLQYQKSGNSHWHCGRTVNISRTGILFQTEETLPQSATLDMRLQFPAHVILSCQGSIVRSDEGEFAIRIHRYKLGQAHDQATN